VGLTKADAAVLALVLQNQDTAIKDVLCIGAPKVHFSYEWIEKSLLPWLKNKYPSAPIHFKAPIRSSFEQRNLVPFKDFFQIWGIKNVQVMDIDEYEGADHLFDLNQPECPSGLHSKFDLIVDGGSLEHCFNLPNALNSIGAMLRENGVAFHTNPANLMIDHGFFQVSPTLYSDYYEAAGFDLLYGGLSHTSTKIFALNTPLSPNVLVRAHACKHLHALKWEVGGGAYVRVHPHDGHKAGHTIPAGQQHGALIP
jgi:hypothetical protein